jgi:mycothiol synthase
VNGVHIEVSEHLEPSQVRAVLQLVGAVSDADGVHPLSEHSVLHLRHGGDVAVRHLLLSDGATLAGYAHIDVSDELSGSSAELAIHPAYRRRGHGRALVEAAVRASPDGRLRLWAHGEHPGASALAATLGFTRARVLFQLRRRLLAPIPEPEFPPGVRIRAFRPGHDEAAWITVNARAFASHPEQGAWTERDLKVREAEPWFDPAGFLLAERDADGELLGFHWTKVHGDGRSEHDHEAIGEVYVLGVDPAAQGLGLGRSLTLAGLRYLRGLGLSQAMLYVDESNPRAVELYKALGFTVWSTDVSFQRG